MYSNVIKTRNIINSRALIKTMQKKQKSHEPKKYMNDFFKQQI